MKQFLMGNQILVKAAYDAGAVAMFGYPITPTTEVLSYWTQQAEKNNLISLQTEDEMAAGFGVLGAVLAGKKAFTATAGPGMILMQDPLVMAEAMRLPMVVFDGQRGGPSTGQVIYSQQEVNLSIYGGNGEGLRIVYSTSSLQDLYYYGKKVFENAWKYRFPGILLYDGYQGKMKGVVDLPDDGGQNTEDGNAMLLVGNMRNTYNLEEELGEEVLKAKEDFDRMSKIVVEYETLNEGVDIMVLAHGIVASAAKIAIKSLQKKGLSVGLFRPITLSPFPVFAATKALDQAKKAILFESSLGQFARLIKGNVRSATAIFEIQKPGVGFTPEEIEEKIREVSKSDEGLSGSKSKRTEEGFQKEYVQVSDTNSLKEEII